MGLLDWARDAGGGRTGPGPRGAAAGVPVDSYPRVPSEVLRGQVRRITEVGEEILRRRCRPVTGFGTADLASLIDDMFAGRSVQGRPAKARA